MRVGKPRRQECNHERGMTLFLVAASLVVLLAISALAIDLGMLYVTRSEAQRAADAAALAGAQTFVTSTFTSDGVPESIASGLATQQAIDVGGQNFVGGVSADIHPGDVTFDLSNP
ncbi:MAG: pilus assembly protein TadG-related protein, partial [Dehalococcoidia bacterium]